MLRRLCFSFALACVYGVPLMVHAEGISGNGTSMISLPPTTLRMQVDVTAEGKTMADAVAALKARREAIQPKLVALGAAADSVTFTPPRLHVDSSQQARRMEMMMRSRMPGKATTAKPEEKVTLATTAKAEWALKGSPDESLVYSHELKKKIEEAIKINAAPSSEDAAAEEEEAAEEASFPPGYDNGEVPPGTPAFVYVAKISPEELEKHLAATMAKAREQASQTAKAAGVQLGALNQLRQSSGIGGGMEYLYGQPQMNRMMYQVMSAQGKSETSEAIGPDIGSVTLAVSIEATWLAK